MDQEESYLEDAETRFDESARVLNFADLPNLQPSKFVCLLSNFAVLSHHHLTLANSWGFARISIVTLVQTLDA